MINKVQTCLTFLLHIKYFNYQGNEKKVKLELNFLGGLLSSLPSSN